MHSPKKHGSLICLVFLLPCSRSTSSSPPGQYQVTNFGHALMRREVGCLALFQKSLGQEALCTSAFQISTSNPSGLTPFLTACPAQGESRFISFPLGRVHSQVKFGQMVNPGCKYFSLSSKELLFSSRAPGARDIWTSPGSPITQFPQEYIEP